MKKTLRSLAGILTAGIFYLAPTTLNAQWAYLGTPGISTGTGTYQSMALGSDGTLYVAYNDQGLTPTAKGVVMKYTAGAWSPVGAVGFTANSAEQGSLAIGPGDSLYFAYQDGPSGMASAMRFDGTNWVQIGSAGFSAGTATYVCMEVDNAGTPYVAYIDGATNAAYVKTFDGTNWVGLGGGPAQVSAGSANWLSMDIDASGNPWIGYADGASTPFGNNMTVMRYNGSSWVTVGASGFSGSMSGIIFADLTISPSNEAYVAYSNPMVGVTSTVQKFDGVAWNIVGTAGFNASNSIFNTVVIDSDDVPYLAYMDGASPSSNGSVMGFDASVPAWSYVGAPYFSGAGAGYFTSLVDGNTYLYVASSDGSNGGKTSVMRYQLCNPADQPTVLLSPASVCEGDSLILTISSGSLNDDTDWRWYAGSCGGTALGTGLSTGIVADSTTIYVSGGGTCFFAADSCTGIVIEPYDLPATPTATQVGSTATITSSSATGNQWYTNGNPIAGATSQNYVVPTGGWYYVTVTNGSGCSATSDSIFVAITGLNEISKSKASVYPVPFSQNLNVNLLSTANMQMSIQDVQGRTVYTAAALQTQNSLDLSHLASGLYYLVLQNGNEKQVYRIEKQ